VRDVIREIRIQGTSVFLNSHLLSEIEVTCDRVGFIQHGEVVRVLELASFSNGQTSVTIRVSNLPAESLNGLSQWGREIHRDGEFVHMIVPSDTVLPEVTRYLVARKAEVFSITPNRMSLEDIFIETVGKDGGL
jgi:ABC-2 type transport system ATP-binding protein